MLDRSPFSILRRTNVALLMLASIGICDFGITLGRVYADELDGASEERDDGFHSILETLQDSCSDCHANGEAEGGFSLDVLAGRESLVKHTDRWDAVRGRILERTMPPPDSEPLPDEQRVQLTEWIDRAVVRAICNGGPQAGPPLFRRMTRQEYAHTIRDLLNVHFDVSQELPEEGAGGEGFTNASETLIISPDHAERYLVAADRALAYVARNSESRQSVFRFRPDDQADEFECARANLKQLAKQAFRRPIFDEEVEAWMDLYRLARSDDLGFEASLSYAMRSILVAPEFLFLIERPAKTPGIPEELTSHELATRLSYFLWASMPDSRLRSLADSGILSQEGSYQDCVRHMLTQEPEKLNDSMDSFVGQWLGTADLGVAKKVDRELHEWMEEPHVAAMRDQPVYALQEILQRNGSLLELIDASWTHLNNPLLEIYQLRRGDFEGRIDGHLTRVELGEKHQIRGGLLAMAGVHAVSSYPRRTSPVLRGGWVLETMLGVELPAPPPDVPALDESVDAEQPKTLRERLEQHRSNAACASCHDRMDPIGFAMENFDEIGRWRERDSGGVIDAVAVLADGTTLKGLPGLKSHLLERKDEFVRQLTKKMLGYALGRGLLPSDRCTIEQIVQRLREDDYRAHTLILGIVESAPFRMKR